MIVNNGCFGGVLAALREVKWLDRPFLFQNESLRSSSAVICFRFICRCRFFSLAFELKYLSRFFMSLRFGEDEELSWHIVDAVKVEVIVRFADSIFERQSTVIAGCGRF